MICFKSLQEGKTPVALLLFLSGSVFCFAPLFASSYLLTLMITALHFVYLSQCWNLIFGYTGQLALGNGVFYAIAGYFSAKLYLETGLTPYLGGIIGAIAAVLFSIPIGAILFRSKLKGLFFALFTYSAMEILKAIFNSWDYIGSSIGMLLPLKNAPLDFMFLSRLPYYYISLFMVVGMILITILLEKSKLGHRAIAVRENEDAAEASGIDCFDVKMKMFALCAFLTGLAGVFYTQFMLYIVPEIMFSFPTIVLLPMLGVIVGGRGTVFGPVIGSMTFSILGELLRQVPFLEGPDVSSMTMMLYGLVLIIVSLKYYSGLMGIITHLGDNFEKRVAERKRTS
jgi:branched-chain amino acid transport system permease protein